MCLLYFYSISRLHLVSSITYTHRLFVKSCPSKDYGLRSDRERSGGECGATKRDKGQRHDGREPQPPVHIQRLHSGHIRRVRVDGTLRNECPGTAVKGQSGAGVRLIYDGYRKTSKYPVIRIV